MVFKKCVAEFIGTFLLCYVGIGAVLQNNNPVSSPIIFVCLIVGLASGFGPISGCHLNPSVSLAFFLNGQMKLKDLICYFISQFTGAYCGFLFLYQFLKSLKNKVKDLACNVYGELSPTNIHVLSAFLFEAFITCFFVYVILVNCHKKEAPFIIAFTIGAISYLGGNLTGGSMNPARSLAPALIMGGAALKQVWLFMIAPLVGSCGSVLLYRYFFSKSEQKIKEKDEEELMEINNTKA